MVGSTLAGMLAEKDLQELDEAYRSLLDRRERVFKPFPGENFGESQRISTNALILRQALLHRAIGTFEGSVTACKHQQAYSMILSIRGQFEATAALGYLYSRLASLNHGHLFPEVVDKDIYTQLLGCRNATIPEAPEAKQILTLLEYADKAFSRRVFRGSSKQHALLTDCYQFLCEFCHPNFHSNSIALDLNKETEEFNIRHGDVMRDIEINLITHLLISTPAFVELFDLIPSLVKKKYGKY